MAPMAVCFRRIINKSLSYQGLRNQFALSSHRGDLSICTTVTQDYSLSRFLVANRQNRGNSKSPRSTTTKSIKRKDEKMIESTFLRNDICRDKLYLLMNDIELTHCAKECKAYSEKETQKEVDGDYLGKGSSSQLQMIQMKLSEDLPKLFVKTCDFNIYHESLVFENHFTGTTTIGFNNYVKQLSILRLLGTILYACPSFEVLKITTQTDDGSVRVRWRIKGTPSYKALLQMLNPTSKKDEQIGWLDGFSIFYVKSDGLIHKHVASKLMPSSGDPAISLKNPLAAKLALIIGINKSYEECIFCLESEKEECVNFLLSLESPKCE